MRIPTVAQAEAELEAARKQDAHFIAIGEADYPPYLRRVDHPPPLIAVKGAAAVFRLPRWRSSARAMPRLPE